MTDITQLIEALQAHKQADEEGIMCTVSRQAVSEAVKALKQCAWQPIETAPKDGTVIDVLLWGTSRMPDVQWGMTDGMAVDIETWIDTFSAMPVWGPCESPEIVTHWCAIPAASQAALANGGQ